VLGSTLQNILLVTEWNNLINEVIASKSLAGFNLIFIFAITGDKRGMSGFSLS